MFAHKHRGARRGVVLLVILGLMAMFGMVALAFVLLTGHARRAAEMHQRAALRTDSPEEQLQQAFLQVARGTNDSNSVLGPHSLLEDMYGDGAVRGSIQIAPAPSMAADPPQSPVQVCGGQLIEFTTSLASHEARRLGGCVLTMLKGQATGLSTRIVGYREVTNPLSGATYPRLQILAFESVASAQVVNFDYGAYPGDDYLVNGTPFSGSGFGYNPSAATGPRLNAPDADGRPYALRPNPTAPSSAGREFLTHVSGQAAANEDYDAVDYQNMLLAMMDDGGHVPIPSLHRPALINYWVAQTPGATTWRDLPTELLRKIMLRPLTEDHPNFDGGNPNFDAIGYDADGDGQPDPPFFWDVDNDGDGIPDSIWVDLGFPVRSTPEGRLYKPLFAILCVDLDGRLNLNAHGCLAQLNVDPTSDYCYYDVPDISQECLATNRLLAEGQFPYSPAGTPYFGDSDDDSNPDYPNEYYECLRHGIRGLGAGPAEINLLPLFDDGTGTYHLSQYQNLLVGSVISGTTTVDGRYGESTRLLSGGYPGPGLTAWKDGDGNWHDDLLSLNKFFYWRDYPDFDSVFGTAPDLRGFLSIGLDLAGQPLYSMWHNEWWGLLRDNPYQLDLSRNGARELAASRLLPGQVPAVSRSDNPFSIVELERLLRPYDVETPHLRSRLDTLCPDVVFDRRHEVTTESWDVPCPSGVSVASLVAEKLEHGGFVGDVGAQLEKMLAPETLAGLRMNLNRPFGNGKDDEDDNTVVDDYYNEAQSGTEQLDLQSPSGTVTVILDHDNDGADGAVEDPRAAYARHLYVLMMAVVDMSYLESAEAFGSQAAAARYLAQWAVNVADFRDRDSIMTRFAYDPTPFDADGWSPTEVVWGCERPELLITETLAFHDRRTENLQAYGDAELPDDDDNSEKKKGDNIKDLDQRYRPQGSLFVEVYNPWINGDLSSQLEPTPGELYDSGGVNLAKTTPNGNSPVWRLAIKQPGQGQNERTVYFVGAETGDPSSPVPVVFPNDGAAVQYYRSSSAGTVTPVPPGRYAVIGPGGAPNGDVTYLGFKTTHTQDSTTRYIDLSPSSNPAFVKNNGSTVPSGALAALGVMVDRAKDSTGQDIKDANDNDAPPRLSTSEPTGGYAPIEATRTDEEGEALVYEPNAGKYVKQGNDQITDKPLDVDNNAASWETLGSNGTTPTFRIIYLERLADPLRPFDETANPYCAIDSMAVDLTCFNGLSTSLDYNDEENTLPELDIMFHTRERGQFNDDDKAGSDNFDSGDDQKTEYVLWKQEPAERAVENDPTVIPDSASHYFTRKLKHSFGYLSEHFGTPRSGVYAGHPLRPFPWLTWLNRPFANPLEIMLVPALSSDELLAYPKESDGTYQYYRGYRILRTGDDAPQPYEPLQRQDVPFPHLLNFFHSSKDAGESPQLHCILEYLRVPSPFVETEVQCNPAAVVGGNNHRFHPPLHMISRYREPGRLNLNTIFSPRVFRGLLNLPNLGLGIDPDPDTYDVPDPSDPTQTITYTTTLWHRFVQSRRGYYDEFDETVGEAPLRDPTLMDERYPTRFARPFRSSAGVHLVPTNLLRDVVGREVDSTILRTHPKDTEGKLGLFEVASDFNFNNTDRNPFFRYQALERLGNLVTTRSNVYAVWITMGYFEVEPAGVIDTNVYPDGYQLGAELGSDTGEVTRHRAFYIFDRSIPVAFERGQDHNVEEAVLVKRFIE